MNYKLFCIVLSALMFFAVFLSAAPREQIRTLGKIILEIDLDIEASPSYKPSKLQRETDGGYAKTAENNLQTKQNIERNIEMQEDASFRKMTRISNKMIAAMFNSDSSVLYDDMKRRIRKMAAEIRNRQYKRVIVEGFTDSKEEYSQELSFERAKAVYEELLNNFIDRNRLEYVGLGSKLPIENNNTPNGRQANRRVEVLVE